MGSDHCPVSCELFDEIYEGDNKLLLFKEGNLTTQTPGLCAKNLARFSGNQQTLKSFFTKQEIKGKEAQERKFEVSKTGNDKIISAKIENVTNGTVSSDSSKDDICESLIEQLETKRKINQAPNGQVQKAKLNPKVIKEKSSKTRTKSKLSPSTSQASLTSFFKKTSQDILSEEETEGVTESIKSIYSQGLQGKSMDSENISNSPNSSEKSLEDMLNNIEDECTEISSNNNKKDIQSQWSALFKPRPIPNCTEHGDPCKEYTVNKPGINQGRRFYLCSR
jgi:AP endonuclease 2